VTARIEGATIDARHPLRAARFWAAALGWELDGGSRDLPDDADPDSVGLADPSGRSLPFGFNRVPEAKMVKNRMHFDIGTDGAVDDEVARLEILGATIGERHEEDGYVWVVMQDVEGNEFCVGAAAPAS
jgi:catechol 2,3-dioxygenase-like lactoylglutathione lyase family enzyme